VADAGLESLLSLNSNSNGNKDRWRVARYNKSAKRDALVCVGTAGKCAVHSRVSLKAVDLVRVAVLEEEEEYPGEDPGKGSADRTGNGIPQVTAR
jgi:hypothetical protein